MSSSSVAIKLAITVDGEELCRRVRLSGDSSSHYEELVRLAVELATKSTELSVAEWETTFVYTDLDGDKIWIATNDDVLEALDHFSSMDRKVFKILTTVTRKAAPTCASTQTVVAETVTSASQTTPSNNTSARRSSTTPTNNTNARRSSTRSTSTSTSSSTRSASSSIQIDKVAGSVVDVLAAGVVGLSEHLQSLSEQASMDSARSTTRGAAPAMPSNRPFIHGRHTCDGCLATPIIGTRFHATNLPDYDLCGRCKSNYQGSDITFEPAVADRDCSHQDRWARRHARGRMSARRCGGVRVGPARRGSRGHGPPPHVSQNNDTPAHSGYVHRQGPPHHGPPPPFGGRHHGPPHCGAPPPFGGHHHGPPPLQFGGPPPPPHPFGHHPPHGPPPPHAPPPPPAPYEAPPPMPHHLRTLEEGEEDLAVKEAIRRSLEDFSSCSTSTAEPSAPEEPTVVEDVNEQEASPVESPGTGVETVPTDEEPATEEEVPTLSEEESVNEPSIASISSIASEEEDEIYVPPAPRTSPESPRSTEFSNDAQGEGDVAAVLGEALDKVANAIDDFTQELGRDTSLQSHEIVDGSYDDDDSSNGTEWDLVSDGNQEDLARAAEMIGSALYSSGMQDDGVSHLSDPSSVPTTVASINNEGQRKWADHLEQLQEMGYTDDQKIVEICESLEADKYVTDAVTVEEIVEHLARD